MGYEERQSVPGSHPCLAGHFPGNPVVPAVIILELVLAAVRRWKGDVAVSCFPCAKFKAPLRPDVPFSIGLREIGDCALGFECRTENLVVAEGKAELDATVPSA